MALIIRMKMYSRCKWLLLKCYTVIYTYIFTSSLARHELVSTDTGPCQRSNRRRTTLHQICMFFLWLDRTVCTPHALAYWAQYNVDRKHHSKYFKKALKDSQRQASFWMEAKKTTKKLTELPNHFWGTISLCTRTLKSPGPLEDSESMILVSSAKALVWVMNTVQEQTIMNDLQHLYVWRFLKEFFIS